MPETLLRSLRQGDNTETLLFALAIFVFLLFVGLIVAMVRLGRLQRRLDNLSRGMESANLETVLVNHLERVEETSRRVDSVQEALKVVQAQLPSCFHRSAVVRYDAFEDVGGQQSFSLALLDRQGNGLTLTGVYNRTEMRVYSKAITQGRASRPLSREEEQALRECLAQ